MSPVPRRDVRRSPSPLGHPSNGKARSRTPLSRSRSVSKSPRSDSRYRYVPSLKFDALHPACRVVLLLYSLELGLHLLIVVLLSVLREYLHGDRNSHTSSTGRTLRSASTIA